MPYFHVVDMYEIRKTYTYLVEADNEVAVQDMLDAEDRSSFILLGVNEKNLDGSTDIYEVNNG